MELSRIQEIDMMEALVAHSGGKFIQRKNEEPLAIFRGKTPIPIHKHMDHLSFESIVGKSYNNVPSNMAQLGGLAKLKDLRKATSLVNRTMASANTTYPKELANLVTLALKESGMRTQSTNVLSEILEKAFKSSPTADSAMHTLELSPVDYYWDENHNRSSIYSRNEFDFTMGNDGKEHLNNTDQIIGHALTISKQSSGSFDAFLLSFQRLLVDKNISMNLNGDFGPATELGQCVVSALRDGFQILQRSGNAKPLRSWMEECAYVYSPLVLKKLPSNINGIKMLKDVFADKISKPEKGVPIDKQQYESRESVWKWKKVATALALLSKDEFRKNLLSKITDKVFPEGVPNLYDIDVGDINFKIAKLSNILEPEIALASNSIISEAQIVYHGVALRKDDVSIYFENVMTIFNETFKSAPLEDKLDVALVLEREFNLGNIASVNQRVMSGEPFESIILNFKEKINRNIGFNPGSATEGNVRGMEYSDLAQVKQLKIAT